MDVEGLVKITERGFYKCKSNLGTQKLGFVAPMPEQIATTTMHFSKVYEPLHPSQRSIVGVPICSGTDATNLIFETNTDMRSVTI